jgi:hypothetical protein
MDQQINRGTGARYKLLGRECLAISHVLLISWVRILNFRGVAGRICLQLRPPPTELADNGKSKSDLRHLPHPSPSPGG